MDRRELIKNVSVASMFGMLFPWSPTPLRPKPDRYNRGLWAQVFYRDCGNIYIDDFPVERSKVGGNEWFDIEFKKGLDVIKVTYFDTNKYLGYTLVRPGCKIRALGIQTKYLKQ